MMMLKRAAILAMSVTFFPLFPAEARWGEEATAEDSVRAESFTDEDTLLVNGEENTLNGSLLTGNWAGRYWSFAWIVVFAMEIDMDSEVEGTFILEEEYGCYEGQLQYDEPFAVFEGNTCDGSGEFDMECYVGIADKAMHCSINMDGYNTYGAAGKVPWEPEVPLF